MPRNEDVFSNKLPCGTIPDSVWVFVFRHTDIPTPDNNLMIGAHALCVWFTHAYERMRQWTASVMGLLSGVGISVCLYVCLNIHTNTESGIRGFHVVYWRCVFHKVPCKKKYPPNEIHKENAYYLIRSHRKNTCTFTKRQMRKIHRHI